MTVTGTMVLTRGGAVFALDQRIADALLNYAVEAAKLEGLPPQTWCRKRWKLKDYEAKHILKGNASKAHYEYILKLKGPHGGWPVGLAVTAAVVGQPIHEFFREQNEIAAREAAHALEHERQARKAYRRLLGGADSLGDARDRAAATREARGGAGALGASSPGRLGAPDDLTTARRENRR